MLTDADIPYVCIVMFSLHFLFPGKDAKKEGAGSNDRHQYEGVTATLLIV